MNRLNSIPMAPSDPILGLTETFKKDPNPQKINLGVGVFKDAKGQTPILNTVKKAEAMLLKTETTKSYLGIDGAPEYASAVQTLLFGSDHEIITSKRAVTAHTPGGTGALRIAGEFIRSNLPGARIWVSSPTWANHPKVFLASGLEVESYPYFDKANNCLDFPAMMAALEEIPENHVLLLHGCCHNPSGIDPTPEQWLELAALVKRRGLLTLIDFAYQGFGRGLDEDATGIRAFAEAGVEFLVASSFSKNFGLYRERVGALTVVANDSETAGKVLSQVKSTIRANYSNPPAHGAAIVSTILSDESLKAEWEMELTSMRNRINGMRGLFVSSMRAIGVEKDFSFIASQNGMFSFSGLTPDQVNRLREEFSIYIVNSGRINVAGLTEQNMPKLCSAIKAVI